MLVVPLRLALLLFLFVVGLGPLFEHILDVLEDDVVNGAVVNLAELVWALATKVNDQASTKIVLDLDHVARHLAILPSYQFLGQLA